MQAQLAVVVSLHTTAPIYSPPATSSSVPATKAQDTERLSFTEKHIQDINHTGFEETASRKAVKNSYTDDIVQAFTTPVEAIDTKTDTKTDMISFMPSPKKFFFFSRVFRLAQDALV